VWAQEYVLGSAKALVFSIRVVLVKEDDAPHNDPVVQVCSVYKYST
jgi:hypothetical protein